MQQNTTLTLELTTEEVNTILAGLSDLPFKQVADLFNKIHIQCAKQVQQQAVNNDGNDEEAPAPNATSGE